jgi:hypothetical protein
MPAADVWKNINDARKTLENTHSSEITMPYVLSALDEIARTLEMLEKRYVK